MTVYCEYSDYLDRFEYHGGTTIERSRERDGNLIWREWLTFNSIEEAETFISEQC